MMLCHACRWDGKCLALTNRLQEAEEVGVQPRAQFGQDFALGLRANPACGSEMISGSCHLSMRSLGIFQAGAKTVFCLISAPAKTKSRYFSPDESII